MIGSNELINGLKRYCLWIKDEDVHNASKIDGIHNRIEQVKITRQNSRDSGANELAKTPHQFRKCSTIFH